MSSSRSIPYQPALDGLRAVAVGLVLLFHGGFTWMSGGYVGVSMFFTLSGYLITALLLTEHDHTGSVAVGRFYARRAKRLLPASIVCLMAVAVATAAGVFENVSSVRRDLFGGLFQVANWVKLLGDASYADLTDATLGRVGPLEHYWSLAIEEQFYWLWPLVMLALLGRVRSALGRLRWLAAMTAGAALAAPIIGLVWGADAVYWSTPARVGEILVGATLAAALRLYQMPARLTRPLRGAGLAAAGTACILWAATTWPAASGPAYSGWLPVFALATAAVIAGVQHESVVRRAMSWAPIVWVGSISYGLYLYHWPLFAVLTDDRLGIDGTALFAVRMAATFAVAALSAVVVEGPVRAWTAPPLRPLAMALATSAAASIAVMVLVQPASSPAIDVTSAAIEPAAGTLPPLSASSTLTPTGSTLAPAPTTRADASSSDPAEPVITAATAAAEAPSTAPETTVSIDVASLVPIEIPTPNRPVRIIVIGDSTAQAMAVGVVDWANSHPRIAQVSVAATPGCGFIRQGTVPTDGAIDFSDRCDSLLDDEVPTMVGDLDPDVVVLMVTMRDVEDRMWADDEGAISPFDDRFRARLLIEYQALADRLVASGVEHVVWIKPPNPASPFRGEQRKMRESARYDVQFEVIDEVAGANPDSVTVIDLHTWMADANLIRDPELRPDGLHLTPLAARWVTDVYLAPAFVSTALS